MGRDSTPGGRSPVGGFLLSLAGVGCGVWSTFSFSADIPRDIPGGYYTRFLVDGTVPLLLVIAAAILAVRRSGWARPAGSALVGIGAWILIGAVLEYLVFLPNFPGWRGVPE